MRHCSELDIVWKYSNCVTVNSYIERAWPHPSDQHPVSPSVSLPHQEYSISLLSFPIRRQTENHSHRKLTNLIAWTTALSNSMKLRAMPHRTSQDRWVMVESSDKMWSLEKEMANHFSILSLRTP